MTAVVAGTARAVLEIVGGLDSGSGIVPRLAPFPGAVAAPGRDREPAR